MPRRGKSGHRDRLTALESASEDDGSCQDPDSEKQLDEDDSPDSLDGSAESEDGSGDEYNPTAHSERDAEVDDEDDEEPEKTSSDSNESDSSSGSEYAEIAKTPPRKKKVATGTGPSKGKDSARVDFRKESIEPIDGVAKWGRVKRKKVRL